MKDIYIFDIDGCVMPPIFSNFVNKNDPRERIVKFVEENGHKFELYPEFIAFYEKNCRAVELVIFLTGRKKSEFGKLTESQLSLVNGIKNFKIIYFPEGKTNKEKEYYDWKVEQIHKIIKERINNNLFKKNYKKALSIKIFDDLINYFPQIENIAGELQLEIELYKIEGRESWLSLLN